MKIVMKALLVALAALACMQARAQSLEWEPRESLLAPDASLPPPRVRLYEAKKQLDDLRDNATADDYRTIRVQNKNGKATFRRIPTEEFAARIERAELDRDIAEAELKARERSLY